MALFRLLGGAPGRGGALLADRGFGSHFVAAAALARGADVVLRPNAGRKVNFRAGRRLGPGDRRVGRERAARPGWASQEGYAAWSRLWGEMVRALGRYRAGDRPGRSEPRAAKRRPKDYTGSTSLARKPEHAWSQGLRAYGSAIPLPIWEKWLGTVRSVSERPSPAAGYALSLSPWRATVS